MSHLLLYYQRPEPATWVFLASFLMIGIFFVFHRFFCVRNLDIVLLILLAPGLMMVYEGRRMRIAESDAVVVNPLVRAATTSSQPPAAFVSTQSQKEVTGHDNHPQVQTPSRPLGVSMRSQSGENAYVSPETAPSWSASRIEFYGFASLLLACGLLTTRMLIDPALVRRPLLEPNLSIGGLSFMGISLFLFLMANVVTSSPEEQQQRGPQLGPGYALLNMLPALPTMPDKERDTWPSDDESSTSWLPRVTRIMAILSNLAIILGIIGIGYWHFDNVKTGIGCATMYLMLPYAAHMTGNLAHTMPAALLVLALLAYRRPLISGALLGLAAGLVYYPLFLLPLWISFYWHRGLSRLLWGITVSLTLLAGLLLLQGYDAFLIHLRWMFGLWLPMMDGLSGIWASRGIAPVFRLPVLVAFILLSLSFVFWPSRKNLGSLMAGSAAVMLAAQFWHGHGGGLFMAWFLPFTLLTVFRPNLDDRIATKVVGYRVAKRERSTTLAA